MFACSLVRFSKPLLTGLTRSRITCQTCGAAHSLDALYWMYGSSERVYPLAHNSNLSLRGPSALRANFPTSLRPIAGDLRSPRPMSLSSRLALACGNLSETSTGGHLSFFISQNCSQRAIRPTTISGAAHSLARWSLVVSRQLALQKGPKRELSDGRRTTGLCSFARSQRRT